MTGADVKYGLHLGGLNPRYFPEVAVAAEEAGFESVWANEHLVFPEHVPPTYLYTDDGFPPGVVSSTAAYDPLILLGTIASVTSTIRLGTNVYIVPLRHPINVARSVLTLDRVSHGRMTLGAGVGWLEEEFAYTDQDFHTRGKRMDETIGVLRRLWSDEVIEHEGPHYAFGRVRFEPKPYATIPIEIGGASPVALRRAATLGDGWIEIGVKDHDKLAALLGELQRYREEAGRSDVPFTITSSQGRTVDAVRRTQDLGVDRIMVTSFPDPPADAPAPANAKQLWIDGLRRYADQVMAKA
jgi:probable F420-dependent oxidoreductase